MEQIQTHFFKGPRKQAGQVGFCCKESCVNPTLLVQKRAEGNMALAL